MAQKCQPLEKAPAVRDRMANRQYYYFVIVNSSLPCILLDDI